MYRSATTGSEKPNRRNFLYCEIAAGQRVHSSRDQTQYFWLFRSAAIPYVVRSTIGLLSDSYASCSDFLGDVWSELQPTRQRHARLRLTSAALVGRPG